MPDRRQLTLAVAAVSAIASGCSSTPLDDPAAAQVAGRPALPRVVGLRVVTAGEDHVVFGSEYEWTRDILDALLALEVCTEVRALVTEASPGRPGAGEAALDLGVPTLSWPVAASGARDPEPRPAARGSAAPCDMVVAVRVESGPDPLEVSVVTEGALLDALAWSIVPFVPWWIPDVTVRPGLEVRIERYLLHSSGELQRLTDPTPIEAAERRTCHLDRHGLLSWETLGAVVVPPFVFDRPDEQHLAGSLGPSLRQAVGVQVAAIIKESTLSFELLENLGVDQDDGGGWSLVYEHSPELSVLHVSVDGSTERAASRNFPVDRSTKQRDRLPLRHASGPALAGSLLRIEAWPKSGTPLRYSLRVPGPAESSSGG